MARTSEQYRDQMLQLQPPGAALPIDPDSTWARLLHALADEFARIDVRGLELIEEADIRTTLELVEDWERVAGLPDECSFGLERTLQNRRADLQERLTARGGQSIAYYIERAANVGHDVTISETKVSRSGVLVSGDELVGDPTDRYAWTVSVPVENTYAFVSGVSVAGERLGYYEPTRLECLFGRLKPAHTTVLWNYVT